MMKVIYVELFKKLKVHHINNWQCTNQMSLKMKPINFLTQTDRLIQTRRSHLVFIIKKKRTCHIADFDIPEDQRVKVKEGETMDKYLDVVKTEKEVEHEGDGVDNCCWSQSRSKKTMNSNQLYST